MTKRDSGADRVRLRPPATQGASAGAKLLPRDNMVLPEVSLDDIDRVLIEYLLQDGKMSNRVLAAHAGISESAVSIRLRKLVASGAIIFTALIDWEEAGFDWFVIARIKTQARSPRDVATDVSQIEQCEAVAVCLGSHDVIAYFLVKDRVELHQLTNDDLPAIRGISEMSIDLATETWVTENGRRLFLARAAPPIRLPAPKVELDDLDIAILQDLIDDGRQSSRKIARSHDVSEGTIRTRLARLTQAGLVRVVAMVEPVALGLAGVIACVSLRANRASLSSIKKELATMPELVFMAVCVGSADLNLTLTAADPQQAIELIATQIQTIEGVLATDTIVMVDVIRFSPYMKRLKTPDE
ncbi:Lrp/AsnC family transcriptional regulator [Mycobacterium heckeshornense]|uniref:Lrp/AsnC family transcriptional regulator n=1 Tax=Mycobacterium heckeshornense TaxID=110505 RepID=UPI001364BE75|nr:Lrp/AsnC family transcriptional regulator [Mycobacterium heckeshornense]MCV7033631.1 Lrp/AsnC family transcriptional regulator [Mycobacterium heckeshornense]